jgi:hypothetical protein
MSWLGQIRSHRRDETWSASLWKTFFSTSMGAQIPVMTEKPLATCGWKKFQLDPLVEWCGSESCVVLQDTFTTPVNPGPSRSLDSVLFFGGGNDSEMTSPMTLYHSLSPIPNTLYRCVRLYQESVCMVDSVGWEQISISRTQRNILRYSSDFQNCFLNKTELLNLQKSGQFPDVPVRMTV